MELRMNQRHHNLIFVLTEMYGDLTNVPDDSPAIIELRRDLGSTYGQRRQTDLDEKDKALYISLWEQGYLVRDIGCKLGVSSDVSQTISSTYRSQGLIKERPERLPYKYTDMNLEKEIIDLINSGVPIDLIPSEVNMSLQSVRIYVKRAIKKGIVKKIPS